MPVIKRFLALAALVSLAGCGKADSSSSAPATSSSAPIAVRECEEFVKQYEACMSKVPAPQKGAMEGTLARHREDFRKRAEGPDRDKLRVTCRELLDGIAKNPQCK